MKKEDVDSLPLSEITGPVSSEEFANRMTEHDLVLSNQSDDNDVTTISGLVQGEIFSIEAKLVVASQLGLNDLISKPLCHSQLIALTILYYSKYCTAIRTLIPSSLL